jgi:hypothetical protein
VVQPSQFINPFAASRSAVILDRVRTKRASEQAFQLFPHASFKQFLEWVS